MPNEIMLSNGRVRLVQRQQPTNNGCYPSNSGNPNARRESQLSNLLGNVVLQPERKQTEQSSIRTLAQTIESSLEQCQIFCNFVGVSDQGKSLCLNFETDYEDIEDRLLIAVQYLREQLVVEIGNRMSDAGVYIDRGVVRIYVWINK